MSVNRFSSRRHRLDQTFLSQRLQGAQAYDRIAGYFSSSILALVGDALESVSGQIRVICNSDLSIADVQTAQAAKFALRQEWTSSDPVARLADEQPHLRRLHELLRSSKMQVRVLPAHTFGLEHGKAGVVTLADGSKTAFMGSANETISGWRRNYELVWEDTSVEAVEWVQAEFDYLWNHPHAVPLADFVIEDIGRLAQRRVIETVEIWREDPQPAEAIIETPVFAKEYGLWEHQKYFIKKAFDAHDTPGGARFVLADTVGLGKTIQLAVSAMLMALKGDKPILIIAPKSLLGQWQDEMRTLLDMPSAVWNGKQWIDENDIEYPPIGEEGIKRCPRRVGIISQGLITRQSGVVAHLREMHYECIIVDEAHRARRSNLAPSRIYQSPEPNNLMAFLLEMSSKTKSMLLATATPVQIHPIEAWDLLSILARGNDFVLGDQFSLWQQSQQALGLMLKQISLPADDLELWRWIRNPLPPSSEHRDFQVIRQKLALPDSYPVAAGDSWSKLRAPEHQRIAGMRSRFAEQHNPFIRHIVRRTRDFLEHERDPETGEPYLKAVKVELFGEEVADAIQLTRYLGDAYHKAEEFCDILAQHGQSVGFFRTILLRRLGSSVLAGLITARKLLGREELQDEFADTDDINLGSRLDLIEAERQLLREVIHLLEANPEIDPKRTAVLRLLRDGWLERGCIIFSQYYDSVWWLANELTREFPETAIGIYAGGQRSGILLDGLFVRENRDNLKKKIQSGLVRLVLGTDAASEGLNLQKLGTLINLDLPWNPTRLEQRKGRIQRIGQIRDSVLIYNMRYRDSVEDRVHELLSKRLESIYTLFGQLPDVLDDVWILLAEKKFEEAQQIIDKIPDKHPFEMKYNKIEKVAWESCSRVLDATHRRKYLSQPWS